MKTKRAAMILMVLICLFGPVQAVFARIRHHRLGLRSLNPLNIASAPAMCWRLLPGKSPS